jgi:O-antigen/teichoic acid export membrane protein
MTLKRGPQNNVVGMVLNGALWMIASRILRILVTFMGVAVLARVLKPEDFGVVTVALALLHLVHTIIESFIHVPTIREDDLDRAGLANLIMVSFAFAAIAFCGVYLLAPTLETLFNAPRLTEVLRVIFIGVFFQPLIIASVAVLNRQHRFAAGAGILLASAFVYVCIAIPMALWGFGIWSLVFGQIISLAGVGLVAMIVSGIPLKMSARIDPAQAWRLGGMASLVRSVSWLGANIDTFFASSMLGAYGIGIYSRAYNISSQLKEPFSVLDVVVRQAFVAQKSLPAADARRVTLVGLRLLAILCMGMAAVVIVLREPVVFVLLGRQWTDVVAPLGILIMSVPLRVIRMYLDGVSYTRGSIRHMLMRNLFVVALLTTGLVLFAANGVTAIAIAVTTTHLLALAFTGNSVDRQVAGTLGARFGAVLPGVVLAACFVGLNEGAVYVLDPARQGIDWALRALLCTLLVIGMPLGIPGRWLPYNIRAARRRIIYGSKT